MILELKVVTSSSRRGLFPYGKKWKACVRSVPEKGKANKELLELVSEKFKVDKEDVTIIKGKSSSYKLLEVKGL